LKHSRSRTRSRTAQLLRLDTWTDRLVWLALGVSFFVLGALPPLPHDVYANYVAAAGVVFFAVVALIRWRRRVVRRRQQQEWRETAGRMDGEPHPGTGTPPAPDPDLVAQVEEHGSLIAEIAAQQRLGLARLDALSEGLVRTFTAAGREVPDEVSEARVAAEDEPTTPFLRLVGDTRRRARPTGT
jgi:hypothetical protein